MSLALAVASKMPLFFMSLGIVDCGAFVANVKEIGLNLDNDN
jgi:hypothetical protein